MLRIRVVAVGRLKERFWADAAAEYLKRLQRFAAVEVIQVDDVPDSLPDAKVKEGAQILRSLRGRVVLLDVDGKQLSSEGFAQMIDRMATTSGEVSFVVGGSNGVSDDVRARADDVISFSQMTFPHMLFRVMLLEQLYRGLGINNGSKYHK